MTRRTDRPRKRQVAHGGFTLLELILVIGIISVLIGFMADKALRNFELAEKAAMETQAMAIKSALNLQMAALITAGREREIERLIRQNPFEWLKEPPWNYLGALAGAPQGDDKAGNWYHDTGTHETVYLVRRADHFDATATGGRLVRYRVTAIYDDNAQGAKSLAGLTFSPVERYRWFDGGL
jgi:prepilin-type N-terminal cleavage/methylation domain-containing protein